MGLLLALASAVCYGIADFVGGLLSRRADGATVALTGQAGGLVLTLAAAPLVSTTGLAPADLYWGALSGVGTGLGMLYLYRGLSQGHMSVVVPLSAVGGLAIPVLVVVALLGDRPPILAWLGIALAVPALWLVSQTRTEAGRTRTAWGTANGLVASLGIALQYLALAQAGPAAGIWPVVAGRLTATLTIMLLASPVRLMRSGRLIQGGLPTGLTIQAGLNGGIAALALVFYLLATQRELVSIAVVLSSLYPAIPVLLGITTLRERLTRRQTTGLIAAGAAIAMLTAG